MRDLIDREELWKKIKDGPIQIINGVKCKVHTQNWGCDDWIEWYEKVINEMERVEK